MVGCFVISLLVALVGSATGEAFKAEVSFRQESVHQRFLRTWSNLTDDEFAEGLLQSNASVEDFMMMAEKGCGMMDVDCWINTAKDMFGQIPGLGDKITNAIDEAAKLKTQIEQIKPVLEKIGTCLRTLPGGSDPLQALEGLSESLKKGELPQYVMKTYIKPMIARAEDNLEGAIDVMSKVLSSEVDLIKDGKMNEDAIAGLGERMVSGLKELQTVDPTIKCLSSDSFLDALDNPALHDLFGKLASTALEKFLEVWNSLTGPGSFIGNLISTVTEHVQKQLSILLPATAELEKKIANALDSLCTKQFDRILHYIESIDVPPEFCEESGEDALQSGLETGISFVISSILEYATQEFANVMRERVWFPLLAEVTRLVNSAQSAALQAIVGLLGLVPEAGGPIGMAITIPLGQLFSKVTTTLGSDLVKGMVDAGEQWLLEQIPEWSKIAAEKIVGALGKAIDAPQVKAFESKAEGTLQMLQPVLELVEPFTNLALELAFPKIDAELKKCKENLDKLVPLVQVNLGSCDSGL